MSFSTCSAGALPGPDFCFIFAPCGYDEPEILPSGSPSIGLTGADGGHSPFTGGIVQQWSRSDVEARSKLVFNAIQPLLSRDVEDQAWDRLSDLFKRVA